MENDEKRYADRIMLACGHESAGAVLKDVLKHIDAKDGQHQAEKASSFSFWQGALTKDGTAVVSVSGTLYKWSYTALQSLVESLEENPECKGIVFSIDSPGGMFSGAIPCAKALATEVTKPHAVYVDGMACSAAYLLASAAAVGGKLFAEKSSTLGSVGIECSYLDMSGMLAKMGIKRRVFHSSHAGKKNLPPESKEGQDELEKELDECEDLFVGAIAEYRNTGKDDVYEKFGQGLTFHAAEAKERGMADEVCEGIGDVFDYIASVGNGGEEGFMDLSTLKDEEVMSALQSRPNLVASIKADAVQAERERVARLKSYKALALGPEAEAAVDKAIDDGEEPEAALDRLVALNKQAKEAEARKAEEAKASLLKSAEDARAQTPVVAQMGQPKEKTEADMIADDVSALVNKNKEE